MDEENFKLEDSNYRTLSYEIEKFNEAPDIHSIQNEYDMNEDTKYNKILEFEYTNKGKLLLYKIDEFPDMHCIQNKLDSKEDELINNLSYECNQNSNMSVDSMDSKNESCQKKSIVVNIYNHELDENFKPKE